MKRALTKLFLLLFLTLVACTPATTRAVDPALIYLGSQEDIYSIVLNAIASDPGVPRYKHDFDFFGENMERIPTGPWTITSSDRAGGFISAAAQSTLVYVIGEGDSGERESHTITAAISGATGINQTQVVLNPSDRAVYLREKIVTRLDEQFERAQ